jgi:transposase-like protein
MSMHLTLPQLFDRFPNDVAAECWLVRQHWPDGMRCPSCDAEDVQARPTRKPQPYRCRVCRRDFSVKTDTVMHGSNLGCRVWVIALYWLTSRPKGVSSRQRHRDLGISYKAAWHLSHRIREAYHTDPVLCQGPAEVDETYVGGRETNEHADRKLRAGRGTVGKTPLAGLKNRPGNAIRVAVVHERGG